MALNSSTGNRRSCIHHQIYLLIISFTYLLTVIYAQRSDWNYDRRWSLPASDRPNSYPPNYNRYNNYNRNYGGGGGSVAGGSGAGYVDPYGRDGYSNNENNVYSREQANQHRCYDSRGRAQRCMPEFVNAAYRRPVKATNTCGTTGPSEYCIQTGTAGGRKTCGYCYARNHGPNMLNDLNDNNTITWWQSETMMKDIQYPNMVNISISLGKTYDITHIRLRFHSPRPDSMAIYKKASEDGEWVPFQYFSNTCEGTFNTTTSFSAPSLDSTRVLCSKEFSDISPLRDGNVIFTTLQGRILKDRFSKDIQEFITATAIRIVLVRLNTFGDEIFKDPNVLKSYYYAISDLDIGGRCKCNGHASRCLPVEGQANKLRCACEHHTKGPDCNQCEDFYNDEPWKVATISDPHVCKPCECNGRSNKCYFDRDLYEKTGRGGHCIECLDNTDGPHCERCKEGYYMTPDKRCIACNCNREGSTTIQCNSLGQCDCQPGVEGQRCDRCAANHYGFSETGCTSCACNVEGSHNNTAICDASSGQCRCKENVEGQHCERCKPGFFNLEGSNEFGCLACFCFGHSSVCRSAGGYNRYPLQSIFVRDDEGWKGVNREGQDVPTKYDALINNIGLRSAGLETVYFLAPTKFLNDQRASYNQFLEFEFHIEKANVRASFQDVILEGSGLKISSPIFGQGNPLPNSKGQTYRFRLNEHVSYGWSPRLNAKEFISILSNLTAIKIRATYLRDGSGFLNNVKLESAMQQSFGQPASWIESCKCPEGYVGQFCESCAPGYRHEPVNGGRFAPCLPCNCNGHADYCDPDLGECRCRHNTAGLNCEVCANGYYGNALNGTENDCKPCPCPNHGACTVLPDEQIVCLECPEGYGGSKCDLCVDGYYGDPQGKYGNVEACRKCDCSGNVDPNAVGNCNTTSGECVRCIHETDGFNCDKCKQGYFGDALKMPRGDCKPCNCHDKGTAEAYAEDEKKAGISEKIKALSRPVRATKLCDKDNGQCTCMDNVMGRQCDRCMVGYWNIRSGVGCEPCNCDIIGSINRTCNEMTGQCRCRPGVTGKRCDKCLPFHYGFSSKGCTPCACNELGSTGYQCNENGQCPCKPNIQGLHCDKCRENMYDMQGRCKDCPPCYGLIQDSVDEHRKKLGDLTDLLEEIERNPEVVEDETFEIQLNQAIRRVDGLLNDAQSSRGVDGSLVDQLRELKLTIETVKQNINLIKEKMPHINVVLTYGDGNITLAEDLKERAEKVLSQARRILESEGYIALDKARERSNKFGQQNKRMSQIAEEAKRLADEHQGQAVTIRQYSREALNTSQRALEMAQSAINTHNDNRKVIDRLTRELNDMTDLLHRTKKMGEEAKREAEKAYKDVLEIYTNVNSVTIPDLGSDKMRSEALRIVAQAKGLMMEADELMKRFNNSLNGTDYKLVDAKDLLAEANRQQQITDKLMAEVDKAFNEAKEAIDKGDSTLKYAQETAETLEKFDVLIQESKSKSDIALLKVEEIRSLINEAQDKTEDARKALSGALADALEARDVANEAKKIAEDVKEDALKIQSQSRQTRENARLLKEIGNNLHSDIEKTENKMNQLEGEAENDSNLAKDALERANQAKSSASDAKNKVNMAMAILVEVFRNLEDLDDIDSNTLEELERKLNKAEDELKEADLDSRLDVLSAARERQSKLLHNYDDLIDKLTADVNNVREIRDAIPDKCHRRVRLEP